MEDDKKAMKNMFNISQIYYDTSEKRTKLPKLAQEFFNALDNDDDGKVQIHEFLGFMTEQGLTKLNNRHLFNMLDRDGNGSLDFMEAMCLFYIVKMVGLSVEAVVSSYLTFSLLVPNVFTMRKAPSVFALLVFTKTCSSISMSRTIPWITLQCLNCRDCKL
ncbi:hypothetical protein TEA_004215 [Camellia sinensis var. sinensis]|uniref:EF-hand domain-containing protein n=1 Tax=Camellia sinensis var. sinensis TaxID=542762 RepID=A0A4S4EDA9_CAMSN|nr:hypothetical protein TEA_004215 [Camellia sinensis var. sinensis]